LTSDADVAKGSVKSKTEIKEQNIIFIYKVLVEEFSAD